MSVDLSAVEDQYLILESTGSKSRFQTILCSDQYSVETV